MTIKINSTEFRQHVSTYLSQVEQGEEIHLFRHGRLLAKVIPPQQEMLTDPSWRQWHHPIEIQGALLSDIIIENR